VLSASRKLTNVTSMDRFQARFNHDSLDVTLAYLKGKDAESEEPKGTSTAAAWRCTSGRTRRSESH